MDPWPLDTGAAETPDGAWIFRLSERNGASINFVFWILWPLFGFTNPEYIRTIKRCGHTRNNGAK